ncbi:probable sporulation protein, polysaccharide deacetylase family [Anoxybacillus pushchinoensis]|uniref:Probable sporulation protein, polysaccharide deacetylase family n=2 Tax=Anoxybacillus pushchinoensis TaxID=150248 RepID=A0A1I0SEX8_9BACL|nr:polysaccharide deacetylase family protein [Anoxybacillus pushchinoensis]SFA37953.1 probable sporulation protein, polysaccharide deacetylase family [Anoxybacillus pushchinoensis]
MRRALFLAMIVCMAAIIVQNPWTTTYIYELRHMTATKQSDPLYIQIIERAKQYSIPAQNAKVDRVWKAIPGYNGLEVDVEASYEQMKRSGIFSEQQLVYKQVRPTIHLSDLPPSPIYRGHPDKPMVSFLINVAWGSEHIPNMLHTLEKHNVRATFFLEGRWVKENPQLAKMIVDAGHEIGNHSYNHPDLKTMSKQAIREQIVKANDAIEAVTGIRPRLFAPPSGSYRDDVVHIAHELGMYTILWTVDTIDWQKPSPSVIVERVTSKVHNGAMILMHPTVSTVKALEPLIQSLQKQEYEMGDVSTLLSEERIVKSRRKGID